MNPVLQRCCQSHCPTVGTSGSFLNLIHVHPSSDFKVLKDFFFFLVFLPFLGLPLVANGGCQVRGLIRAVAAGLCQSHSNARAEPHPKTYTTATAAQDLSRIRNLHHNSRQRWILNPLREARDQTHHLMVTSRIHFCCTTTGIRIFFLSFLFFLATHSLL